MPGPPTSRTEKKVDFGALHRRLDEAERALARDLETSEQARAELLARRAQALATPTARAHEEGLVLVAFHIGGERYGVPIHQVEHVVPSKGISPLPGMKRHVLGAILYRSRIHVVLDLRQYLGLRLGGMSDLRAVLIVSDGRETFGLAAESVEGRIELPKSAQRPAPEGPFVTLGPKGLLVLAVEDLGIEAVRSRPTDGR